MPRSHLVTSTQWITTAAQTHGNRLPPHVAERLGITLHKARRLLGQLVESQWLQREGSVRRPTYRPHVMRQVVTSYPLPGLQEDLPWARDFAPYFDLSPNVARMAEHAFTELLNNAIDHSGGSSVTVSMRQTAMHLQMLISDDGCGVFDRIQTAFEIPSAPLAMLELSKGKLTSAPERHRGHGLFFTSRLADVFHLHANDHAYQCRSWDEHRWHPGRAAVPRGSSIYLAIALDTERTLDEVLRAHSHDGQSHAFEATTVPLNLLLQGGTSLASRAQAKRVASRLATFRRVMVDFNGVVDIGQGFADELFRVFAQEHPAVELLSRGMAPQVASAMEAARSTGAG